LKVGFNGVWFGNRAVLYKTNLAFCCVSFVLKQ